MLVHVRHNSFTLPGKSLLLDHNPGIQSAIFAIIHIIYSDYLLIIWHAGDFITVSLHSEALASNHEV